LQEQTMAGEKTPAVGFKKRRSDKRAIKGGVVKHNGSPLVKEKKKIMEGKIIMNWSAKDSVTPPTTKKRITGGEKFDKRKGSEGTSPQQGKTNSRMKCGRRS